MPLKANWINGQVVNDTDLNAVAVQVNANTNAISAVSVNVQTAGAVGNGTTNDATAIQAIITALPSSGGTLYFPNGIYKFGSTLTCSKPVRFVGAPGATLKLAAVGETTLVFISSTSNVVFENLTFDGDQDTSGAGTLLYLQDVLDVVIRNCNFIDSAFHGVVIERGFRVWIEDNIFTNIYYSGILIENPGSGNHNEHIWIRNNYMDNVNAGQHAGNSGIQAIGVTAVVHRYIHILDNTLINVKRVGFGLDSIDLSRVSGNTIIASASSTGGECIAFTGSNNVFSENYCQNKDTSSAAAILQWAEAARTNDKNQIINNRLTTSGQGVGFVWGSNGAAINDLLIQGNHCYGNNIGIQSYVGGGVTSGSQTDVLISGNNITGNTSFALNVINDSGGITGSPVVVSNLGQSPTIAAAASSTGTTQTLANDLRDKLITLGLIQA